LKQDVTAEEEVPASSSPVHHRHHHREREMFFLTQIHSAKVVYMQGALHSLRSLQIEEQYR
jgi:copper oxidase (laccase) domain-containing protein